MGARGLSKRRTYQLGVIIKSETRLIKVFVRRILGVFEPESIRHEIRRNGDSQIIIRRNN